jgi:hypothetical protein
MAKRYAAINNSLVVMTTAREMETILIGEFARGEAKKNGKFAFACKSPLINKSLHDLLLGRRRHSQPVLKLHNFSINVLSRLLTHLHYLSEETKARELEQIYASHKLLYRWPYNLPFNVL